MGARSKNLTREQVGLTYGWKSGLEEHIARQIERQGHTVRYETEKIKYVQPAKKRTYTPDFILDNGIIIETKGRFTVHDRMKHLYIKEYAPDLDVRFVFNNPNAKLYKGAKSTYADWCTKNGFKYAQQKIPEEWFHEV